MKPWKILVLSALALPLAACTQASPPQPQAPIVATAENVTTPAPTTSARQILSQDQFTTQLQAAGWNVKANAYSTALAECQAHTTEMVLEQMAGVAKPHQAQSLYKAYADAVLQTC